MVGFFCIFLEMHFVEYIGLSSEKNVEITDNNRTFVYYCDSIYNLVNSCHNHSIQSIFIHGTFDIVEYH
jgi:hypothetical protein